MENVRAGPAHASAPGQPLTLDSPSPDRGQAWEFSPTSRLLHSWMVSENPLRVHVLLCMYRSTHYMYRSYIHVARSTRKPLYVSKYHDLCVDCFPLPSSWRWVRVRIESQEWH